MRVFGGLRAFYYLQTLLTGDTETRRNPASADLQSGLMYKKIMSDKYKIKN